MKPLFLNGSSKSWRRNMIHRKFSPENQNKHCYVDLTKHHNPSCCTSLSAKKRGRQKYSQKYGYVRCRGGELVGLACNKVP